MRKTLAILTIFALAGCAGQQPRPASAPSSAPTVPIPPPPPKGEPDLYTGLQAQQLRAALGPPAFARKDGAAEMWRYDTGSCRAFFFFTGAPAKVQHVETVPRGTNSAADPACLSALRSAAKTS